METLKNESAKEAQAEAHRLMRLLARRVRLSGKSMSRMGKELGMTSSMISQILAGDIRPQLSYLFMVAGSVGITPREFFSLAYPDEPDEPEEPGITWEQLDLMVEASVKRAFRRLGAEPEETKK